MNRLTEFPEGRRCLNDFDQGGFYELLHDAKLARQGDTEAHLVTKGTFIFLRHVRGQELARQGIVKLAKR